MPTDRVAARFKRGNDTWYRCRHRRHGGNVQVQSNDTGFPLFVSGVRPGSCHDIACARELLLPAVYPDTALRESRLPMLADKGFTGAGIGVHVPPRRTSGGEQLAAGNQAYNALIAAS